MVLSESFPLAKQPKMSKENILENKMEKEYDLSKMKRRQNPYAKSLKKQITIRIDDETVQYFKNLALETGLPYQNLINLYLRDCAQHHRKLSMRWAS